MADICLESLDKSGLAWANSQVTAFHYLHRAPDPRTMPEGLGVTIAGLGRIGLLLFGRPEATRMTLAETAKKLGVSFYALRILKTSTQVIKRIS